MSSDSLDLVDRPSPTELVAQMLLFIGRGIVSELAQKYVALSYDLEAYMGAHEGILAWEALDVADFVRTTTRGREARIARCCNLAAVLSWAWGFGGARAVEIAAHYDTLLRICPPDARAHAYIRWGADRARGIEDDPPPELLPAARRGAA